MFEQIEKYHLDALHVRNDAESGLKAIVAIHNTSHGPALGGCRFITYESENQAFNDAIRLAQGMSYKAALAGLEQGGGKSVILRPRNSVNREALFREFGRFVDSLNGQYITAIDSGTTPTDMDIIARHTRHVTCTSSEGSPAPYTVSGVFDGIRAAVKHKLDRDDLEDLRIVVQGVGSVGYLLGKKLAEAGAHVVVSDIDAKAVERALDEFAAHAVEPELAHKTPCAVFSPCGLSGAINSTNIEELGCMIVAGSANVQLATADMAQRLHDKGILYAPDYVINAGGLIYASMTHKGAASGELEQKIARIYHTLSDVFVRAEMANVSPAVIVEQIARLRIYGTMDCAA